MSAQLTGTALELMHRNATESAAECVLKGAKEKRMGAVYACGICVRPGVSWGDKNEVSICFRNRSHRLLAEGHKARPCTWAVSREGADFQM